MNEPTSPTFSDRVVSYWRKIGAGSLLLSLTIHVVLLVIAGMLLIHVVQEQPSVDFMPGGQSKAGKTASEEMHKQVKTASQKTLTQKNPIQRIAVAGPSVLEIPSEPPQDLDNLLSAANSLLNMGGSGQMGAGQTGSGGGTGPGIGIGTNDGWVASMPQFRGRCSSQERLQKLRESGGSAECERAVSSALEYLKTKQKPDGSWGTRNKCAMTGFALLCYLGRCETPDSPFYGDTVMKGAMFLIEAQKKNPRGIFSQDTSGNAPVYEHGIATYALGEMYSLARMGNRQLPGMREAFEKGVQVIIENQQGGGSWVYDTDNGGYAQGREDLSVTGWQYQALKAAKLSNLRINGLHSAIEKTTDYLQRKQTKDGGIGGANREAGYNQWELTGTGTLGLQTLGGGKGKNEIKKAVAFSRDLFTKEPPVWQNNTLYSCYYYQQAFFQAGGDDWKFWNDKYLSQILANQKPDGSWQHAKTAQGGDWIYSTALNTLMLEVYYRYLRVADRESRSLFDR